MGLFLCVVFAGVVCITLNMLQHRTHAIGRSTRINCSKVFVGRRSVSDRTHTHKDNTEHPINTVKSIVYENIIFFPKKRNNNLFIISLFFCPAEIKAADRSK